jgi:hypothetical protein
LLKNFLYISPFHSEPGVGLYTKLHKFLEGRSALFSGDDGLAMRTELEDMLEDPSQVQFWPVMEELLFYEEHS